MLTIGETAVGFISAEKTEPLSDVSLDPNHGGRIRPDHKEAKEVASLKLRVEGHVERMIDRESISRSLEPADRRTT